MNLNLKCFVLVFVTVGGYKLATDGSSDENYSLLTTNQSFYGPPTDYIPAKEFTVDENEFQRKSSTDNTDIRSEALIKKIHPFVYPKQFNTLEGMPTRGFNVSNENFMEIRNAETNQQNSERFSDDSYSQIDSKLPNVDLVPLGSNLYETSKHGHFHYGYFDKPHQNQHHFPAHVNNCLLGMLHLQDPLVLLGVLGFVAYLVNSVLSLVDRLNLPLVAQAGMPTAAVTSASATTKTSIVQRQNGDDKPIESNQRLLKDFERILQMAIDAYEQKINSI